MSGRQSGSKDFSATRHSKTMVQGGEQAVLVTEKRVDESLIAIGVYKEIGEKRKLIQPLSSEYDDDDFPISSIMKKKEVADTAPEDVAVSNKPKKRIRLLNKSRYYIPLVSQAVPDDTEIIPEASINLDDTSILDALAHPDITTPDTSPVKTVEIYDSPVSTSP